MNDPLATNNPWPAIIFGLLLLAIGGVMMYYQRLAWRQLSQGQVPPLERQHLLRRLSRRSQVAGMIILIGIMIPLGDLLYEKWLDAPGTFAIYWLIVLGLACWTGLLALGDMVSTYNHTSTQIRQLERQQLELELAADKLRRARENGTEQS